MEEEEETKEEMEEKKYEGTKKIHHMICHSCLELRRTYWMESGSMCQTEEENTERKGRENEAQEINSK